jgi:hypothetical protein
MFKETCSRFGITKTKTLSLLAPNLSGQTLRNYMKYNRMPDSEKARNFFGMFGFSEYNNQLSDNRFAEIKFDSTKIKEKVFKKIPLNKKEIKSVKEAGVLFEDRELENPVIYNKYNLNFNLSHNVGWYRKSFIRGINEALNDVFSNPRNSSSPYTLDGELASWIEGTLKKEFRIRTRVFYGKNQYKFKTENSFSEYKKPDIAFTYNDEPILFVETKTPMKRIKSALDNAENHLVSSKKIFKGIPFLSVIAIPDEDQSTGKKITINFDKTYNDKGEYDDLNMNRTAIHIVSFKNGFAESANVNKELPEINQLENSVKYMTALVASRLRY